MKIEFIRDLPVDPMGSWTKRQRKDWMHPDHGPLPDELALVQGNEKTFKVAVWLTAKHILIALELFEEDPEAPWSEDRRGELLQTFRWTVNAEEEIIECRTHSFPIPDIEDEGQWRRAVIQMVMTESVRICLSSKVGSPWKATLSLETPR